MKSHTGYTDAIACLADLREVSLLKKGTDVVIDAGPWGRLVLPCHSKEWQEFVCVRLFHTLGKDLDTCHAEWLLSDKIAGR